MWGALYGGTHRAPRKVWRPWIIATFCVFFGFYASVVDLVDMDEVDKVAADVQNWAWRFGVEISNHSLFASNYTEIKVNFEDMKAQVVYKDPKKTVSQLFTDLGYLVSLKSESVKALIQEAELLGLNHKYSEHDAKNYHFVNSKRILEYMDGLGEYQDDQIDPLSSPHRAHLEVSLGEDGNNYTTLELRRSRLFYNESVNFNLSAVHVSTNIYEKAPYVVNAIQWSSLLDAQFAKNRYADPLLSFQFFCSSRGFLRHHPAFQWPPMNPDMYECRMRQWYIQAAASAKDVVLLLDVSGSMTGLRKEIARNVVINILETLSDNDFVSVLKFSEKVESLVECFNETLVQANQRNIREFRANLQRISTEKIANFTEALIKAFEMLQKTNKSRAGSQCNQAIMLITDGAPSTYEEIFKRYNWPNIPVRMFTYLIGREVTETKEVNWMACANRGYYTHVTTLAEVREQVLKYIPVMSRPIVLSRKHPIIWTSAYPAITETLLTDHVWEERERARIRNAALRTRALRPNPISTTPNYADVTDDNYSEDVDDPKSSPEQPIVDDSEEQKRRKRRSLVKADPVPPRKRAFMRRDTEGLLSQRAIVLPLAPTGDELQVKMLTTVAAPIFNISNASIAEPDLLGVVGIDVPISDFQKATNPFRLGVNGYAFVINRNGHLLFHPDLRPMYTDLVKPYHSSVDLLEVELLDTEAGPRTFNQMFTMVRQDMISGRRGWLEKQPVRIHQDGFRRVVTRHNTYQYGAIPNSVFSLAIALPEPYGLNKIEGQIDITKQTENLAQLFAGSNWRIHPDWDYCVDVHNEYDSPEARLNAILWRVTNPENVPQNTPPFRWKNETRRQSYKTATCDRELLQSLVFDAKATSPEKINLTKQRLYSDYVPKKEAHKTYENNGIVLTFVATRSGLLRFHDYRTEIEKEMARDKSFYDLNVRAIDELFYRRAVDFHSISNNSFVYSVPFNAGKTYASGESNDTIYVTGSRAIFLGTDKKAPVAVVGVQIKHRVFQDKFFATTARCERSECHTKCSDDSLDCYLLDNNGFVVVSETLSQIGSFFGEVDSRLFNTMVKRGIYTRVRIYDYQAICMNITEQGNPANIITSPFKAAFNVVYWLWQRLLVSFIQKDFMQIFNLEWMIAGAMDSDDREDDSNDKVPLPAKRTPLPCDQEIDLYEMKQIEPQPIKGKVAKCSIDATCDKHFIVQAVPSSNLIMLVVFADCDCPLISQPLERREVPNSTEIICNATPLLTRERPDTCINYHAGELAVKEQCGVAFRTTGSSTLLVFVLFLTMTRASISSVHGLL